MRAKLLVKDGMVYLEGCEHDHVELPQQLTPSFFERWAALPVTDPCHMHKVLPRLSKADRTRLARWAKQRSGRTYMVWRREACRWPHLTRSDGVWSLVDETIVFHRRVDTGLVSDIYITDTDLRLARVGERLLSSCQFEVEYGMPLVSHIQSFVDKTASIATMTIDALNSPLRTATVTVAKQNGDIEVVKLLGPSAVSVRDWQLPDGSTFLHEE